MKMFLRKLIAVAAIFLLAQNSFAQVMNPNDPVVEYTGGNIGQPAWGQVGDWVKTTRVNWNTDDYKCYIYKGHIFRLKFPQTYQHNVADGKVYPLFIFFHGLGESGDENIYDNEYQLYHGGQRHKDSVNSGAFDGFLLYLQNQYGFFGDAHYDAIAEIIQNFLVPQNKVDINRIYVNGLSAGGTACWDFTRKYPNLVAANLPISAASTTNNTYANIYKYIPTWHFQGGQDRNPTPATAEAVGNAILNVGGAYKRTVYANRGHGCWNDAWSEPDYFPFMLRSHKANPVPLFGKYEFCEGEAPNVTLGLSPGFTAYEWRRNGVTIPGATSNTYNVTSYGTYEARIRRGTTWSPWSPNPIVVKLKDPTVPPPIETKGLMSRHIPAPDGNNGVTLMQPTGYLTYSWTRQGSATVLSTADTVRATTPGNYLVKVTEQFGCLSEFSDPFAVINANGPNKPDAPNSVLLTALSLTSMKIDWSDNPNPAYNETNFEVYMGTQAGGPYKLVGMTGQDVTTFTATGLTQNTRYYVVIRAVNNTAASAVSTEVNALSGADNEPPTAPGNLRKTSETTTSVGLTWNASTDNIGVYKYDIYINDVKSYVTDQTSFTCYNLSQADSGYTFIVKARDFAGNESIASNILYGIQPVNVPPVPVSPSNITAVAVSYKRINVSWTDNSSNETGFEIFRSVDSIGGLYIVGTRPANTTSFVDTFGLDPNTTYYYRVKAIHNSGASAMLSGPEASWKFNNNYNDASGNNKVVTPTGVTFDAADKREGTHSLNFNGSNQYLTISSSSGDYLRGGYASKTVAFWMKSNSNTGNRIIMDLGGSDDGLAMRLDANRLYAGVARSNTRRNISAPYTSTGWNHIALVYSANTLRLYVNAVEVASNLSLGFNDVGTTSNGSRLGANNGSNSFNTGSGVFSGKLDNFEIYESPLSPTLVSRLMSGVIDQGKATTLGLPAAPLAPTNLVATGTSSSKVSVTWTDNATTESGFKLYKSDDNNLNYVLLATLPANTTSYNDQGLFANLTRYYKVLAYNNDNGTSGYSNEDSATTKQPDPEIDAITDRTMRYGTQLQVSVHAVSPLNSNITFSFQNLPAFAAFIPGSNGNGTISFNNPNAGQQGTYANIIVTATDAFGSSSTSFQLIVNDNHNPVVAAISNVNMNENQTLQVVLGASDQNVGDVLSWSFSGLPPFVSTTPVGNSMQLDYAPGYADHGNYPVTATVTDGNGGQDSRSFTINVNDVFPAKRIYINFTDGSFASPAPWNATNKQPYINDNFPNLLDDAGATTPVGIQVLTAWQNLGNGSNVLGVNTGNNSGVYPDAVIRSAYWTDASAQNIRIYGLDPGKTYSFVFFGSRGNVTNDRTTLYTIKGVTVSLNAAGNSQNTVGISDVLPDPDGTLTLTMAKAASSSYGYLNAMVIVEDFDDGSAPAKPRNIAAQLVGSTTQLTWIDAAYNETAYEVYRSTNPAGPFTLLNPGGNNANLQSYNNGGLAGNTTYYYYVRAINGYGNSPNSDTVNVTTNNGTPVLNVIADVNMRIQETVSIPLTVTDDAGDVVTLSSTNLPSFVTLVDNGNGTGSIEINPGSTIGEFTNVTISATDNHGASSSRQFDILVRDVFNSIYVNFSHNTTLVAPSPWNNFNSVPFAGKSLTNMIDDSGTPTGVSILQVDTWQGANDLGAITGDNTGVFPDNVMKSVYWEGTSNPRTIRISGLNTVNMKYNLVFFASRQAGDDRSTIYTVNGQSVTLNAGNNTTNTVQINGLVPNASGILDITCVKAPTSPYAYLGAIVIQSFVDDGTPFAPSNLIASAISGSAIRLNWSDKSSDEDGFEVYRAESYDGTYSLINTTAPSVTSYTDNNSLVSGKVYYYKVRSVKGTLYSGYTNVASTSTFIYSVHVNFNRTNGASSPWNNTNRAPTEGRVFSNLNNQNSQNSGLAMTIVDNFSGDNPSGMNTGNNSGVWPDNVLRSSWWVDFGIVPKLKISNLNQNMTYSFVFTASRDGGGDRTTVYTINGKSVLLNASFNTMQTVQLDNIKPDENGEVFITVALGQYAAYAYINGMIINGYKLGTGGSGGSSSRSAFPVTAQPMNYNPNGIAYDPTIGTEEPITEAPAPAITEVEADKVIVYPNPFNDDLSLSMSLINDYERVNVRILNLSGNTVFSRQFSGMSKGVWRQNLNLPSGRFSPGVYFLEVTAPGKQTPLQVIKLVKQ